MWSCWMLMGAPVRLIWEFGGATLEGSSFRPIMEHTNRMAPNAEWIVSEFPTTKKASTYADKLIL